MIPDYEALAGSCGNQNYTVSCLCKMSMRDKSGLRETSTGPRHVFLCLAIPYGPGKLHRPELGRFRLLLQRSSHGHWFRHQH